MGNIFIILYFVIGLYLTHIGVSRMEKDARKALNPISQVLFVLLWPIFMIIILMGGNDEN